MCICAEFFETFDNVCHPVDDKWIVLQVIDIKEKSAF